MPLPSGTGQESLHHGTNANHWSMDILAPYTKASVPSRKQPNSSPTTTLSPTTPNHHLHLQRTTPQHRTTQPAQSSTHTNENATVVLTPTLVKEKFLDTSTLYTTHPFHTLFTANLSHSNTPFNSTSPTHTAIYPQASNSQSSHPLLMTIHPNHLPVPL